MNDANNDPPHFGGPDHLAAFEVAKRFIGNRAAESLVEERLEALGWVLALVAWHSQIGADKPEEADAPATGEKTDALAAREFDRVAARARTCYAEIKAEDERQYGGANKWTERTRIDREIESLKADDPLGRLSDYGSLYDLIKRAEVMAKREPQNAFAFDMIAELAREFINRT
jgi:hypothetical protein